MADKTNAGASAQSGDNGTAGPATEVDTSGAPQQIVDDVDLDHPAVDADPRKNTTADQNKIDFNDPTLSGREAVERNLGFESNKSAPKAEKD